LLAKTIQTLHKMTGFIGNSVLNRMSVVIIFVRKSWYYGLIIQTI